MVSKKIVVSVLVITMLLQSLATALTITSGNPDHPPTATLYTKTGTRKLNLAIKAKDDRGISRIQLYVNDELVLDLAKSGNTVDFKYKNKLEDKFAHKRASLPTTINGIRISHKNINEGIYKHELDINNYYLKLPVGTYTITLVVTDLMGQTHKSAAKVTIKKDNPPWVTLNVPASVRTNGNSKTITATVKAGDDRALTDVWLYIDGKEFKHWTPNKASFSDSGPITLSIGKHTIKAIVKDNGGESRQVVKSVNVVKNQPPTLSVSATPNPAYTVSNTAKVTVKISYSDDRKVARVLIKDGSSTLKDYHPNKAKGSDSFSFNLKVGDHTITVQAWDDEGLSNSKTTKVTVIKDNPPTGYFTVSDGGDTR
jgi:hypothetical protein